MTSYTKEMITLYHFFEKKKKFENENERKAATDKGVLYSSGMIAGEGLIGVLLAVLAAIPAKDGSVLDLINLGGMTGRTGGVIFFVLLILSMLFFSVRKAKK